MGGGDGLLKKLPPGEVRALARRAEIAELSAGAEIARPVPAAGQREDVLPVIYILDAGESGGVFIEGALVVRVYTRSAIDRSQEIVIGITVACPRVVVTGFFLICSARQCSQHAFPDGG